MAVTPIRNMRVDDERWAAWEAAAAGAGVSITKLVVATMDNAGISRLSSSRGVVLDPAEEAIVVEGPVGDVPAVVSGRESGRRPERKRTKACPHRISETSFCRYCDGGT